MATTLLLRKTVAGWKPADRLAEEATERFPLGSVVKAEVTQPRNLQHHRKMYALLEAVFPHQTTYPTMERFEAAIKCAIGYGETMTLAGGKVVFFPDSWSFAKLDQQGFNQVYDRVLELITTRILPGIGRDDVGQAVDEILAGREGVPA